MNKQSVKKCKGTGKAIGYGCGNPLPIHKFGLCLKCFKEWLFSNDGAFYLNKIKLSSKKKVEKEKRIERRTEKEEIKKKAAYEKDLQEIVNEIARLIDCGKGCISCTHGWTGAFTRKKNAGHFHARGNYPAIRFHLDNIFLQCEQCNTYLHSNDKRFIIGLREIYGNEYLEFVDNLPLKYPELHLTREDLKEAIKRAKFVRKEILSGIDYSRWEINNYIGIYK